jgi:hypothetical protein
VAVRASNHANTLRYDMHESLECNTVPGAYIDIHKIDFLSETIRLAFNLAPGFMDNPQMFQFKFRMYDDRRIWTERPEIVYTSAMHKDVAQSYFVSRKQI